MPRGRGGARQGTPGKGYTNRTDLTSNYNNAAESAAGGGLETPSQQQASPGPQIYADQVPNIYDPTSRPDEPVTAGLNVGPGGGREVMPPMPAQRVDPTRQILESMLAVNPNPDIIRLLNRLNYEGR
jgi:hypothetical protein